MRWLQQLCARLYCVAKQTYKGYNVRRMNKRYQPAHMNRYANLARQKPVHSGGSAPKKPRKRRSNNRIVAWWQGLSRKQKLLAIAGPLLAFLVIVPLVTYFILAKDISNPERLMNRNNTGVVLQYNDGTSFYSIGRSEHRAMVPLDQIPKITQQALVSSEDKDFYKHGGFNVFSIVRAAFTRVGGGSTLTQQLAKNTLLNDNRNLFRKYQEVAVSVAIEQNYTKDEIMSMYFNSVYYGENSFGIQEAAKAYFNKEPKDLDLAESAMLIGLLPAPSSYSPISGNKEYAKQRQSTVLTRMVNNGYITEKQKTEALAKELVYGGGAKNDNSIAPHFVEMVIKDLSDKYGYETVMRSGYQVKTTLDKAAQEALTSNIAKQIGYINRMGGNNASGIVIDPTSGQIRALAGSADYNNEQWGKVNMVTTARQPGSSFKPIYYSQALADGVITPATVFKDEKTDFGGGYIPYNATKQWYGDVSVRKSLDWSLNIPSIKIMQKYGIDKSVAGAGKLGITLDANRNHDLTLALGSEEVALIAMTNAYAAFANQGNQFAPIMVTEVKDKFNKTIQRSASMPKQAITKQGAYLISDILADNQTRSRIFGSSLTVPGHTAAVKTGTTNDSRDAWTIGYNPDYVVGVWVGNNDNAAMRSGGSDMAGPIWKGTMAGLLQGKADKKFSVPDGIVQKSVCSSNGGLAAKSGSGTYNEYFMSGALPTNNCKAEPVMVTVCNLDTHKQESINEEDIELDKYSKNLDDCKAKDLKVCDLSTGTVITIDESKYDNIQYSKNTKNCKKQQSTNLVAACNITTHAIEQVDPLTYDPQTYSVDYTMQGTRCYASPATPPTNGQ